MRVTVRDLIAQLESCPQYAEVAVADRNGNIHSVEGVSNNTDAPILIALSRFERAKNS